VDDDINIEASDTQ